MKFKFNVEGLDCPNCAAKLAAMIEKKDGIDRAKINFLSEKLTVESELTAEEVLERVSEAARAFSSDIKVSLK